MSEMGYPNLLTDEELIDELIKNEWEMFQLINNEGGRASCQDNSPEFYKNRKSQFLAWPREIRESYFFDLKDAWANGKNLLFNKYAYMMETTAPAQFEKLRDYLPKIPAERMARMKETVEIAVKWAEEYEKIDPVTASHGRPIRQSQARFGATSVEVYQLGELSSYSERTEKLYSAYVKECDERGINLAEVIRTNLKRLHGITE